MLLDGDVQNVVAVATDCGVTNIGRWGGDLRDAIIQSARAGKSNNCGAA